MISENNALVVLVKDKFEEIEKLSALAYSFNDMALYLGVEPTLFASEAQNPDTDLYMHLRRGQITSSFNEAMRILEDAEKGNITASQRLSQIRRDRGFEMSKLDVFGGFEDKQRLQKLEDYIQSGSRELLTNDEVLYLELLAQFHAIDRRFGRRNTISFFTKPPFSYSYAQTRDMFDEAQNLFYSERNVEKKALRHKKAEQLEEAARQVQINAKSAKEWEIYGNLIVQAAKLQELDKPDVQKLPKQAYISPVRIYSLNPEKVGIPAINRNDVAAQIELLEIPEIAKRSLRRDAMIEDAKIIEQLDELSQEIDN